MMSLSESDAAVAQSGTKTSRHKRAAEREKESHIQKNTNKYCALLALVISDFSIMSWCMLSDLAVAVCRASVL